MKHSFARLRSIVILTALAFSILGAPAPAQAGSAAKTPEQNQGTNTTNAIPITQMIVKYKASASANLHPAQADVVERLSQAAGVSLQYRRAMSGEAHVFTLPGKLSPDQAQDIANKL